MEYNEQNEVNHRALKNARDPAFLDERLRDDQRAMGRHRMKKASKRKASKGPRLQKRRKAVARQ
eukprot:7155923-Pyramimonas_sp.AAC.1